jgi:predicted nucleotidyltransferase
MNLTDPSKSVTSTLDGPALVALAKAGHPLTVTEIAQRAVRGSEIGIRRALVRLVDEGIVSSVKIGKTTIYSLNRDHIAAPLVLEMSRLRSELWRRLSVEVSRWRVSPMYACVFGSAARHDGDEQSDIDILLVRIPTQVEIDDTPRRAAKKRTRRKLDDRAPAEPSLTPMSETSLERWNVNVDRLRDLVPKWSGNRAQIVELTSLEWSRECRDQSEFAINVANDGVRMYEELNPRPFRYHTDVRE